MTHSCIISVMLSPFKRIRPGHGFKAVSSAGDELRAPSPPPPPPQKKSPRDKGKLHTKRLLGLLLDRNLRRIVEHQVHVLVEALQPANAVGSAACPAGTRPRSNGLLTMIWPSMRISVCS